MRQAKLRRIGDLNCRNPPTVSFTGWRKECSKCHECDSCDNCKLYPKDDSSFASTMGLTCRGHPELIIVVSDLVDKSQASTMYMETLLTKLADFAARRGRPFRAGEHLRGDEVGLPFSIVFTKPSIEFPIAWYDLQHSEGFYALQVRCNDPMLRCSARVLQ